MNPTKIPGLKLGAISGQYVAVHTSTPLSYRDYIGCHRGSMYGYVKDVENLLKSFISPRAKVDLQKFNNDFLCVPKNKIIDFVNTSGTLGEPVTIGLTDADLDRLAYNEAISFACAGVTEDDIPQLTTTIYRRFMAGLAYFLGARKLGAGIIRVGAGILELQWDTIQKFGPSYLIVVPSFLLKLIEYAE